MKLTKHVIAFIAVAVVVAVFVVPIPRLAGDGLVTCMGIESCPRFSWRRGSSLIQQIFGENSRRYKVTNYEECIKLRDSIVLEMYPGVCITADGQRFVQEIEEPIELPISMD